MAPFTSPDVRARERFGFEVAVNEEAEKAAEAYLKTVHIGGTDPYPLTLLERELEHFERKAVVAGWYAARAHAVQAVMDEGGSAEAGGDEDIVNNYKEYPDLDRRSICCDALVETKQVYVGASAWGNYCKNCGRGLGELDIKPGYVVALEKRVRVLEDAVQGVVDEVEDDK